ncbi:MAG: AI-2E family transporter [Pirellulales bacterium]
MPLCVSLAVFEGWMQPLAVLSMYVVIELLSNNILEPWIYGSNTGLSPLGIMVSALFWTWLWGTPGLILATPITACITVMGRHFPQFRFLNVLLSDQPPLPPSAVIYQRLLARDQEQVGDVIDTYLKEHGVERLYDEVLLPTVRMAETDRHHGMMNSVESAAMKQDLRNFVTEVGEEVEDLPDALSKIPTVRILCIPAGDEGDEIAGELITQLLRRQGHHVELLSAKTLAGEVLAKFAAGDYDLALISALPPSATMHTRYLCKRLRGGVKAGQILVGYWTAEVFTEKLEQRFKGRGATRVVTRFKDALQWIRQEAPGLASAQARCGRRPPRRMAPNSNRPGCVDVVADAVLRRFPSEVLRRPSNDRSVDHNMSP